MSIVISKTSFSPLSLSLISGIENPDNCVGWTGYYATSSGVTAGTALPVNDIGDVASAGVPYVETSDLGCANPSASSGGLTATFRANGYTGHVYIRAIVADAVGVTGLTNQLVYNCIDAGSFNVNAGPDQNISTSSVNISGATASGGTPPYTFAWSIGGRPVGATGATLTNSTSLTPTANNFAANGGYECILVGTDANGATATDSKNVTRTGGVVAMTMSNLLVTPTGTGSSSSRTVKAIVSGGTQNFTYVCSVTTDAGTSASVVSPASTTTSSRTHTFTINNPQGSAGGAVNVSVSVTDSSSPTQTQTRTASWYRTCLLKGTKITMQNGSKKNIEDLQPGDLLMSHNISKDNRWGLYYEANPNIELTETTVTKIYERQNNSYLEINNKLKVTGEHTMFFYRDGAYHFGPAMSLTTADYLVQDLGSLERITTITTYNFETPVEVYNISVDGWKTYIAEDFITHNTDKFVSPLDP